MMTDKPKIKTEQSNLTIAELEVKACIEMTTLIRCLSEKVKRKAHEVKQRLNIFCKRHGIENIDEYVKAPK